jgi:UDP-N-acetylmuramate dehydrogenase
MNADHLTVEHRVLSRQPLAPLTTLGVGGEAEYYLLARSAEEVAEACSWARRQGLPVWVLSGGSNLVVADHGVRGLTIDIRLKGVTFECNGGLTSVTAAAGEGWDDFVAEVVQRGHAGLACLSGIPGRVGATPIQNVGAYGQDVGQAITRVTVYDRTLNGVAELAAPECGFGYRTSRFRVKERDRYIILSVSFDLQREATSQVRHAELRQWLATEHAGPEQLRDAVIALRRSKSMVFDPADPCSRSCGSFFVNPVVPTATADRIRLRSGVDQAPMYPLPDGTVKIAAAWLIERAGFVRGSRDGSVGLSNKHSLAIVAHPQATARDVCRFARQIQNAVLDQFSVELQPEPVFWGYAGLHRGLPRSIEWE